MASTNLLTLIKNKDGTFNKVNLGGIALFAAFVFWRISGSGLIFEEHKVEILSRAIIDDYKQSLYHEYGYYDSDPSKRNSRDFPWQKLQNLTVDIVNMKSSAPIFSFSAKDSLHFNYDYTLIADGVVIEEHANVYSWIEGKNRGKVRESNAFLYIANYVF